MFSFSDWFNSRKRSAKNSRKQKQNRLSRMIETLEDRTMPAAFTAGNLVLYRIGEGTVANTSAATAAFLDEYTPTGTLVQTIAVPVADAGANQILTNSGTATSEGALTRSGNGQFLTFGGYDAAVGTASVTGTSTATIARVFGRVDVNGVIDTSTTTTAFSANNIRGVVSNDGTQFWAAGANTGVVYNTIGGTGAGTVVASSTTNLRVPAIANGQLYVSSSSGSLRLGTVGTGLPTTAGNTITNLPGLPTASYSPYGYFFADLDAGVAGVDTLYIAADDVDTIRKFSLVGGTWTQNGEYTGQTDVRGITGSVSGSTVTLFATRDNGTGADSIVGVVDASGYNAAPTGTVNTIVTATNANPAWRGISFAPTSGAPVTVATLSYQVTTQQITEGTGAGSTVATVTVTRSGNTTSTVSVGYTTAPGTTNPATEGVGPTFNAGEDYLDATGTLTFGNGVVQQTFQITINRDSDIELNETVALSLNTPTVVAENGVAGATAVIGTGSSTLTINDDDATPPTGLLLNEIFINPPGNDGPNEYFEIVNTTGAAVSLNNVYLAVIEGDGTNAGIADFVVNLSSVGTIAANSTLTIRGATNNLIAWGSIASLIDPRLDGTGSIIENGANTYMLLFGAGVPTEGVDFDTTNDGTLEGLSAYTVLDAVGHQDSGAGIVYGGQLPRRAGATPDAMSRVPGTTTPSTGAQWFYGDMDSILIDRYLPDSLPGNAPVGAKLTPGALNTVPAAGHIRFTQSAFTGSEGGDIVVTLERVGGTAGDVSITLTTADLSNAFPGNADFRALAGTDYTALAGTVVTWLAGIGGTQTVNVPVLQDADAEGNETFQLVLSAPTGTLGLPSFQNPVALSATNVQPAAVGVINAEDLATAAPLGVVINEVRIDQAGFDGGREFIELRNTTGAPVSLQNVKLVSVEGDGAAVATTTTAVVWTTNGIATLSVATVAEIDRFFTGDQIVLSGYASTGASLNGTYTVQSVRRDTTGSIFTFSIAVPTDPGTVTTQGTAQNTDFNKPGMFDYVFDLGAQTIPANGYLIIKSPNYTPAGLPVGTVVVNDARFDNFNGILENGTNSLLLIYSPTALTQSVTPDGGPYEAASDYDTNNDGDLELPVGAVVLDGVGQNDSSGTGDIVYGQFLSSRYTDFPVGGFITRDALGAPFAAGDWKIGDGVGLPYFPPGVNPHPNDVTLYDYANGSTVAGATLTPGAANINTTNTAGAFRFVSQSVSVVENVATVQLAVERIDNTVGASVVTWLVTNGTAQNADWGNGVGGGNTGTLNWAAGEGGIKTFTITINNTAGAEGRETINVGLTATAGVIASGPATVTIVDDDSSAPSGILLNEVLFNPQSSDEPSEYFEVIGGASASLANLYFVAFEGDSDAAIGSADYVFDLNDFLLGTNGLLVGQAPNSALTFGANTTRVFSTQFSESGGVLENGSGTFALVWSQTPIIAGTDYDADNNGTLELLPVGATIVDSLSITDFGSTDRYYGSAPLVQPGSTPDAASRVAGNTTANSPAAWFNGDLFGNTNTSLIYDQNISSWSAGENGPMAPDPGAPQDPNATSTTSSLTWTAGIVTVNTATNHNLVVNQTVTIANVTPAGYNGVFKVLSTPSATSFTYALAVNPGAATVNGTAVGSIYRGFTALPFGAVLTPGSVNYATPSTGVFSFAESTFTVNEGSTTLTVTVNRTGGTGSADVTWSIADILTGPGYAIVGTDTSGATTGVLNFTGTQTSATFTVTITGDSLVEGNELFGLSLSNATNGASIDSRSLLQPTTSASFNAIRYGTMAAILDNDTPTVLQSLVLNELKVDMAGNDGSFEFIEVRGTPGAVIPAGTYVVAIEGDQGSTFSTTNDSGQGVQWDKMGTFDYVFNIGGQTIGANGLLIIKGTVGGHAVDPQTTVVGDIRLNDTANGGSDGGILENGSQSFVLLYSPTVAPVQATQAGGGVYELASDYDRDENGTLEQLAADAVIVDRVGWSNPGNGDFAYSVYLSYPLFNFTPPAAATRVASNTNALDKDAWKYGELIFDVNTQLTYDPQAGYNNVLASGLTGRALTPGAANFDFADTTAPTIVSIDDGDADNTVPSGTTLTYTITFSEDILNGSLTAADLDNAGTSTISIGTITEVTPGVFTVQVTATTPGTLILRVPTGAVVEDVAGNDLVVPVLDNDTVTVTAPTFRISSLVWDTVGLENSASGFTVNFSEAVDISQVNLVTQDGTPADNGFPPAGNPFDPDVIVIGDGVDNTFGTGDDVRIRGTIVFNAARTQMRYLPTYTGGIPGTVQNPGLLPADTYRVTIVSGANAFKTTTNNLDGDADGVYEANDHFATNTTPGFSDFTVVAPASNRIVFSVPDFARGPRTIGTNNANPPSSTNTISIPNNPTGAAGTRGIPLIVNNANALAGFDLEVRWNPALLELVTNGYSAAPGAGSATFSVNGPGFGVLTQSNAANFSATPGPFIVGYFFAKVPDAAASLLSEKHVIDLTVLSAFDNASAPQPFRDDDGVHIVAYQADSNADGLLNAADNIALQRVIANFNGNTSGLATYQNADARLVGDVTNDGGLNAGDTISLNNEIVGDSPFIDEPGTPGTLIINGPDPVLFIGSTFTQDGQPQNLGSFTAGANISIPISVFVTETGGISVAGADVTVRFDTNIFQYQSVTAGAIANGSLGTPVWSFLAEGNAPAGEVRITGSAANGPNLAFNSTSSLFFLNLQVKATATPGSGNGINLMQVGNGVPSALFDNSIATLVLAPAPSNAATDDVDGTLTVLAAAQPSLFINKNIGPFSPGQTFQVPILFRANDVNTSVAGADVKVQFDPNVFQYVSTASGQIGNGSLGSPVWSILAEGNAPPGEVRITGSAASGPAVNAGQEYSLYVLTLQVKPTAVAGSYAINLLDPLFTALFDNNIVEIPITPDVAAADNQSIDGSVLVQIQLDQPPFVQVPTSTLNMTSNPIRTMAGRGLVFNGANTITVIDPNTNDTDVRITVSVPVGTGTLTLGSLTNLNDVSGNGTNVVTFDGSPADLTAALASLTYRSPSTFSGNALLTITANDQSSNFGGPLTDTKFVNITVVRLFINEVMFNPPGTDAPNEYLEIRSTIPNFEIPVGTFFVGIEANGTGAGAGQSAGSVNELFNIGSLSAANRTTGTNGLLVIRQQGSGYSGAGADGATVVTSTAAGFTGGVGFATNNLGGTDIENAGTSFLLLSIDPTGTAPALSTDLDGDNNGSLDGTGLAAYNTWAINDSVGFLLTTDSSIATSPNFGYASVNFRPTPTGAGGASTTGTVVTYGSTVLAGYAARVGNSTGSTFADWIFASDNATPSIGIAGTAPNWTFGTANVFTGATGTFNGRPITSQIGRPNYFINGISGIAVNGGGNQRSQVTSVVVNFVNPVTAVNASGITLTGWVGAVTTSVALAGDGLSATITFSGGTDTYTLANSQVALLDGRYQLAIAAGTFTSAVPGGFDNTGNGSDGGIRLFDFHRFFGDTDGDEDVDATDRNLFNAMLDNNNEGGEGTPDGFINSFDDVYFPFLDYENDNNINRTVDELDAVFTDYERFLLNFAIPRRRLAAGAPGAGVPASYLAAGPRI